MKLGNFLSLDPHYPGKGLQRGGKLDQEVWNEFAHDTARLYRTAAAMGQSATWLAETRAEYSPVSDEDEFPAGQLLTRLHLSKERNRQVVARKKRKVLRETGRLACEACGFDFFRVYGPVGVTAQHVISTKGRNP
jgi:5-methylcytosine-specific restriction protein A